MTGSNMNAELDAGPNQTWYAAGSVLGPDFGEILTSLQCGWMIHAEFGIPLMSSLIANSLVR